jgi:hypothetical protein
VGLRAASSNPAALQAAVKDGRTDIVPRILDLGGDMHYVDSNGSLLQVAAANSRDTVVSLLFEKGYDSD